MDRFEQRQQFSRLGLDCETGNHRDQDLDQPENKVECDLLCEVNSIDNQVTNGKDQVDCVNKARAQPR